MKKILVSAMLAVFGVCFAALLCAAQETQDCQAWRIAYEDNYGDLDTAGVAYNNVFTRFVPAENGTPAFWFYVYEKGKTWLCEGARAEDYVNFPEYVAVRVYEGQQEEAFRKSYSVQDSGSFVISKDGAFTPFYFYADGQNHAVLNYLQPNTVVVSADFDGETLARFDVSSQLRQENCGEEKPEFAEMLEAVKLL